MISPSVLRVAGLGRGGRMSSSDKLKDEDGIDKPSFSAKIENKRSKLARGVTPATLRPKLLVWNCWF